MSYLWLNDPGRWHPDGLWISERHPAVGSLIGWRYGAWRVLELRITADVDLTDEDRKTLDGYQPEFREKYRPYAIVLKHEFGPTLVEHVKRLHDRSITTHRGVPAGHPGFGWWVLPERHPICNCCGHLWPCQALHRDQLAAAEASEMVELLEKSQPGLCAHCGEVITTRQKWVQFPEESLLVPGMPGPMFHIGRSACYLAAAAYERDKRLVTYPSARRLVTCPGFLFTHAANHIEECTAGPMCTGLHGPSGGRPGAWCVTRMHWGTGSTDYPVPLTNCGWDMDGGCLGGAGIGSASAHNEVAGDLMHRRSRRARV